MLSLVAVAAVVFSPCHPVQRTALRLRWALVACIDGDDERKGDRMLPEGEMSGLRARIAKIQENGLSTPAQKLYEIATEKPPSVVLRNFFLTAPANVQQSMQDAVLALFGTLPPLEFDSQVTTTGDKLAALMLQLQMTGYMLRNAEYVLTVRSLLDLKTRSAAEYREVFERLDVDSSGFLETEEIRTLLAEVYGGEPPPYEVTAFVALMDVNKDGKIGWQEFANALGVSELDPPPVAAALMAANDNGSDGPTVSGTISISLEGGEKMEVDAAAYMEELKLEAQYVRAQLAKIQETSRASQADVGTSISAYVGSLPKEQLKVLTQGISDDVVEAMRELVKYILKAPTNESRGGIAGDETIVMDQDKMQQLCLYQLILGYKLREAEAKGEAQQRLGL